MDCRKERIVEACRTNGIKLLVLFGSRAAGNAGTRSDTDVAVLLDHKPDLEERFRLEDLLKAALDVHGKIDLVVLNELNSTTLGREIARSGKALYDRDGEQFFSFVTKAMKEYADFEPFRRLRREVLRERPGT